MLMSMDESQSGVAALVENLQRRDLDFLEEAAARKMGLIAVTHNRALADRICTRIYDLSAGGAQSDL